MTDTVQRPLSADVAKKTFPNTAGALVADREYIIQHSTATDHWMTHRKLGVLSWRSALLAFSDHRTNWESNGQMRLLARPVVPFEVVATEETLEALK